MSNIKTEFKECFIRSVENDTLCHKNYKNIRFHFVDIRFEFFHILSDGLIEKEKDPNKNFYLRALQAICSINGDGVIEKTNNSDEHINILEKMKNNKDMFDPNTLCLTMFDIPKVKKQLDASYYANLIKKFIQEKCKYYFKHITKISDYSNIGVLLMDAYLLARVFRDYEKKNRLHEVYQKKSNKIIIYAGYYHILNYVEFLTRIGFTKIYDKTNIVLKNDQIIFATGHDNPTMQCINISNMSPGTKKRLFDMNMSGGYKRIMLNIYTINKKMYKNIYK